MKDTQAQMSQEREITEGVDEEKLQQLAQMRAQVLNLSFATVVDFMYNFALQLQLILCTTLPCNCS